MRNHIGVSRNHIPMLNCYVIISIPRNDRAHIHEVFCVVASTNTLTLVQNPNDFKCCIFCYELNLTWCRAEDIFPKRWAFLVYVFKLCNFLYFVHSSPFLLNVYPSATYVTSSDVNIWPLFRISEACIFQEYQDHRHAVLNILNDSNLQGVKSWMNQTWSSSSVLREVYQTTKLCPNKYIIYIYIYDKDISLPINKITFLNSKWRVFTHGRIYYYHLLWWHKTYFWPSMNSYIYFTRTMIARIKYLSWMQKSKHTADYLRDRIPLTSFASIICLFNVIHLPRGMNASRFKTSLFSHYIYTTQ